MDNLNILYLNGNEMCKKIRNYRKSVIYNMKKLKFLDDRPVDDRERLYANVYINKLKAFGKGGL